MPDILDLEAYQGDDFERVLNFFEDDGTTPLDLTGYEAAAQVRRWVDSDEPDAEFTIDDSALDEGKVTLTLTGAETEVLSGAYSWDFQMEDPGGKVRTYIAGKVTVKQGVTR